MLGHKIIHHAILNSTTHDKTPADDTKHLRWRKPQFIIFVLLLLFALPVTSSAEQKRFKILHIMSYHSNWKWTDDQLQGFQEALTDQSVEYKIFQMDTKNHSDEAWKQGKSQAARKLIASWQPDLVYTNDDSAQKYITAHYINSDIPFVFSGVNATPESYGFDKANNITGVLEQEHSLQTLRLLRQLAPNVKRIAIFLDDGLTWPRVVKRLREDLKALPEIEVVSWDTIKTFEEYKQKVMMYQKTVDALGSLGIFSYKDKTGKNVPYQEVLRWTVENSQLPDFSFWHNRVKAGTLCAVAVSGYEQGFNAGEIARKILVEGVKPKDIAIKFTRKGEPLVNLARLRRLDLPMNATPLLSSQVITDIRWDN